MTTIFLFILGFALLLAGAELLVRGAAQLALGLGLPPLVIGLTIVAYGTGSPELVVSMISAMQDQPEIALGNVIGSNIVNILCILGLSAAISPMVVHQQLIRIDVPLMIFASLLLWYAASLGNIGFYMGLLFLTLMVLYTLIIFYKSNNDSEAEEFKKEYHINGKFSFKLLLKDIGMIIIGLFLLVIGSEWLVEGGAFLASTAGVSQLMIGLTIIAFGTSLPELATSVVAAIKGKREIAVGNVIGSNIFNILTVIGAAAMISPNGIEVPEKAFSFDIPVMTAVAAACLPIFFTGHVISRWEGIVFVFYYAAYTAYVILFALKSKWTEPFFDAMAYFVLPLTIMTLGIGVYRHFKAR